jgi:hypothetical protein
MGRSSDTRQRTREAAAELVAAGKRPHEITVDQVYERIRQGSRTTINDALKAWKAERTKIDALDADLPPVVADAMRSLWVTAVEHGERAFEQQKAALSAETTSALERAEALQRERDEQATVIDRLVQERNALSIERDEAREHLVAETAAKTAALDDLRRLRVELDRTRADATDREDALRQTLDARARDYQAAIEAHDSKLRAELDTAMQRLASTQDNMLQQIDDARTTQRRAEARAAEATQRANTANETLAAVRLQLAGEQKALEQERQATARLAADATALQESVAALKDANAELRGRQASQAEQLGAVEGRALAAEQSLLAALAARTERRGPRPPAPKNT